MAKKLRGASSVILDDCMPCDAIAELEGTGFDDLPGADEPISLGTFRFYPAFGLVEHRIGMED